MRSLYTYILESTCHIFERGDDKKVTKIQEILTCVFFDGYFNSHNTFKTIDDIVSYYNDVHDSLIHNISKVCNISIVDFDNFIINTDKIKRGHTYSNDSESWQKSFLYQCETFKNWLDKHKTFPSHNLTFLHHDTSIGICNKMFTTGWSLDDRVETGAKKAGYSNKDDYQKADIYALAPAAQGVSKEPDDSISQELSYWQQAIEGKNPAKFVGISLKKLLKPISSVHTYNMDDISMSIDNDSIELYMPIFDSVKFSSIDNVVKCGGTTAMFKFLANLAGEDIDCALDIRTSAASADSRVFNPKNNPKKKAYDCFTVGAGIQLRVAGSGGQGGRASSFFDEWVEETGIDCSCSVKTHQPAKTAVWGNASQYNAKLQRILASAKLYKIDCGNVNIDSAATAMINWVAEHADVIYSMMKQYTDNNRNARGWDESLMSYGEQLGVNITEDNYQLILTNLFNMVKWKSAIWNILSRIEVIFVKIQQDGFSVLEQLAMFSKGISFDKNKIHLPYIMIG